MSRGVYFECCYAESRVAWLGLPDSFLCQDLLKTGAVLSLSPALHPSPPWPRT